MSKMWCALALISATLSTAAGPAASFSGNWRLNADRSSWGTRPKPHSVTLYVDHKEPAISYSGVVIYSGEDARPFTFSGVVDGKQYPMERSFGSGTAVVRRIDSLTIESVFRTPDGRYVETARTSLTGGGKTLTRRIRFQADGAVSMSTEVYDRQ